MPPQSHPTLSRAPTSSAHPHPAHHQQVPSHQHAGVHPQPPSHAYEHPTYGHSGYRYSQPMEGGYARSVQHYQQLNGSREGHGYPGHHGEGPRNQPTRPMHVDDDEDDEDDGEIKPDSRNHRSGSLSGVALDSKKHQSGDHDHQDTHKCMDCGKVYKHPNCLWKHRWEHSNYWKSATKFLLSKHQQVRMMEAAAILLGLDSNRESDQDAIVSMVSKQRGAAVQSIGSSSSSSSSPPISTKSLSSSPPPQTEHRVIVDRASTYGNMTEAQNNDIQMLTALRNGASNRSSEFTPPVSVLTTP
ncbi:hypothetical protein BGZ83_001370, partial [Gryganskiella cystojenkinii]